MMQHRAMDGVAIGGFGSQSFDDRMRRIRDAQLEEGALVAMNGRIMGASVPWFALRVWTGREKAVEKALSDADVLALVPMRKGPDLRRRHRVIEGTMMPVIHGYVLVQMVAEPAFLTGLLAVEHVIEVLGGMDRPRRVSAEEISKFKALAEGGAYDWEKVSRVIFRIGEKVRIKDGPFGGLPAEVVTCRSDGRGDAVVMISIFHSEVPATIPLALLEKL